MIMLSLQETELKKTGQNSAELSLYIKIKNQPPKTVLGLYPLLSTLNTPLTNDEILREAKARGVEQAYLAWQAVRHLPTNGSWLPNTENKLTGFEPYLLEQLTTADDIAKALHMIGETAIASIKFHHRQQPGFMTKIKETLLGVETSAAACLELSTILGVILARLRAGMRNYPEAMEFRNRTYISMLGRYITYQWHSVNILQEYTIPRLRERSELILPSQPEFKINSFNSIDPLHPYHFMYLLGQFGHPLIRAQLHFLAA